MARELQSLTSSIDYDRGARIEGSQSSDQIYTEFKCAREWSSMKIMPWNIRGLTGVGKRAVKQIIHSQKLDVVLIQESKINSDEDRD